MRTLKFSGFTWIVANSPGQRRGPGPNYFSDSLENVWLDDAGHLHLRIVFRDGAWQCSSVYAAEPLGHGLYTWYVIGRVDRLDASAVGAVFLYLDDTNEIDVEFATWGGRRRENAQYVVQPRVATGFLHTFRMELAGTHTTHQITWQPGVVDFRSIHGHHTEPPAASFVIAAARTTDADVPNSPALRPQMNLWLQDGHPPVGDGGLEMLIAGMEFAPA
jgi:hypothetical protein